MFSSSFSVNAVSYSCLDLSAFLFHFLFYFGTGSGVPLDLSPDRSKLRRAQSLDLLRCPFISPFVLLVAQNIVSVKPCEVDRRRDWTCQGTMY